jgi:hypothetical protein
MPEDSTDQSRPERWWRSATPHVDAADDARQDGSELTDEKTTVVGYLRAHRLTLEMKCADLDDEDDRDWNGAVADPAVAAQA